MPPAQPSSRAPALLAELRALRRDVEHGAAEILANWESRIERPGFQEPAHNLAQYIVLRRMDLRPLQDELRLFGLSTLGRVEGRVMANLDAVIAALAAIAGDPEPCPFPDAAIMRHGPEAIRAGADRALGPCLGPRTVRLMVTLPAEVGEDEGLALSLVENGADLVRINCAHDGPKQWQAMIANVRQAARSIGRPVRVLMDLGGPKCRTGVVIAAKGHKRLCSGDSFLLLRPDVEVRTDWPVQAGCTLASVFDNLRPGAPVWVDEGRLGGVVRTLLPEGAVVDVRSAPPRGLKLKADKGLNFPDTDLGVPPLTDKDLADLDFVAANADLVGYSFVQEAGDIERLQAELALRAGERRAAAIGIVAKIETPRAVRNLPEIIVQGAGRQPFAIMIARGDLGVEIGFGRLAEIQEEILWLCEAAHVPVIWATGVLNGLIKDGQPNRGEMTDAAMSARAECVMLNKGPHVVAALRCLDELFVRMAEHQQKKSPRLRALKSW
ncbi:MAG TPA: pyruvate kinase [Gammaproteobacteria bacterium]|nr:pyruvate kinase [Gammaproteobacteria bacterium]